MKLTREEIDFLDLLTCFGYEISVDKKSVSIDKDEFHVDLNRKKLTPFLTEVMKGIEVKHF